MKGNRGREREGEGVKRGGGDNVGGNWEKVLNWLGRLWK